MKQKEKETQKEKKKNRDWAWQDGTVPATKPEDLNLIPVSYMVEGEPDSQKLSSSFHW